MEGLTGTLLLVGISSSDSGRRSIGRDAEVALDTSADRYHDDGAVYRAAGGVLSGLLSVRELSVAPATRAATACVSVADVADSDVAAAVSVATAGADMVFVQLGGVRG
jgi:hypothetical protein